MDAYWVLGVLASAVFFLALFLKKNDPGAGGHIAAGQGIVMMIRAVTIERKFGCRNSEIAAKLAELLGWKLWDQELTQEIARLTNGTPQVVEQREWENDPTAYRVFKSFVRKGIRGGLAADRSAGNRWPRLAIFSLRVARVCFECSCMLRARRRSTD
jgi:hypothetical protein